MADVDLTIVVNTKKAGKAINNFAKDASSAFKDMSRQFDAVKIGLAGFAAFLGGSAIVNGIEKITDAAVIQEDVVNSLNSALKLAGDFSEEASLSMQDFAAEIEATTRVGDELVIQQLALAKAFNQSNEETEKLVSAAIDLSAATGITLESAVRNLGKTYSGLTGELGEVIPELKNFSKSALESGAAVDFVVDRFSGAAADQVNTFGGALAQLSNTWGSVLEVLGDVITSNPIVIESIKALTNFFSKLIDEVKDGKGELQSYVTDAVQSLIKSLPKIITALAGVSQAFRNFGLVVLNATRAMAIGFNGLSTITDTMGLSFATLAKLGNQVLLVFAKTDAFVTKDPYGKFAKKVEVLTEEIRVLDDVQNGFIKNLRVGGIAAGLEIDKLIDSIQGVDPEFETSGLNKFLKQFEAAVLRTAAIAKSSLAGVGATGNTDDRAEDASGATGFAGTISGALDEIKDAFIDIGSDLLNVTGKLGDFANNFLANIASGLAATRTILDEQAANEDAIAKKTLELESATGQEKIDIEKEILDLKEEQVALEEKAAKNADKQAFGALKQTAVAIGSIFGDGVGKLVGTLLDLLSDPEALKVLVKGIVDALPDIIEALVDALPDVLIILIRALPRILALILKGLVRVSIAFIGELIKLILQTIARGVESFATELARAAGRFVAEILKGAGEFIAAIVDSIKDALNKVTGGASGFAEKTKNTLLGRDGGFFLTDEQDPIETIPTGVPPVPPDREGLEVEQLANAIALAQSQAPIADTLSNEAVVILSRIAQTLEQPQTISSDIQLNEQTFADLLLTVNKDNRRTA